MKKQNKDTLNVPQTLDAEQLISAMYLPPLSRHQKKEEPDPKITKYKKEADELEQEMYNRLKRVTLPSLIRWLSNEYCFIMNEGITDEERIN